jgi:hypothetical protein
MKLKISFDIVELEEKTYHPLIKAEFHGLEEHWWVIDTGASKSVFDESLIDYYTGDNEDSVMATGLGKEVVQTNSAEISDLTLGGYHFGVLNVALVDFLHINNEYSKFSEKKIVGLIGCDFLYPHKAILDFDQREISLIAD